MRDATTQWPENRLGCPVRASYSGKVEPGFQRTEIADGPARYRLIKEEERRVYRVSFIWTRYQLSVFEDWFASVLMRGMRWFTMKNLTGTGMQPFVCHILGEWEVKPLSESLTHHEVSFEIEAFHTEASLPPAGIGWPVFDAGVVIAGRPVDIIDALVITATRPPDIIAAGEVLDFV